MICYHSAEIYINGMPASPGLACSRKAGHDGLCSTEVRGFTSHSNKRVDTTLKVYWPSPKMLRRKLGTPSCSGCVAGCICEKSGGKCVYVYQRGVMACRNCGCVHQS